MLIGRLCVIQNGERVTKICEQHLQQYNEFCAKLEEHNECKKQIREEQRQSIASHLHDLIDIEHKQLIPIKETISKYREVQSINNSDRWIRESTTYGIGNVLMIQQVRNKWVCSKGRL